VVGCSGRRVHYLGLFLIGLSFDLLFVCLERMLIAADVNSSENLLVLEFVLVYNCIWDF